MGGVGGAESSKNLGESIKGRTTLARIGNEKLLQYKDRPPTTIPDLFLGRTDSEKDKKKQKPKPKTQRNETRHDATRPSSHAIASKRTTSLPAPPSNRTHTTGMAATPGSPAPKRRKTQQQQQQQQQQPLQADAADDPPLWGPHYHPRSFVTWNCNGFGTRARHDADRLGALVAETGSNGSSSHGPDVFCLQEARLRASGPGHRKGTPLPEGDNGGFVGKALARAFGDYEAVWSLADTKYAGTLTLIKRDCLERAKSGSKSSGGDFCAFTADSAIDLLLRRLGTTREECGLLEPAREARAVAPASPSKKPKAKPKPKHTQTSLASFFAPKAAKGKAGGASGPAPGQRILPHHPEGRFQFFFFPGMDLLQTYVPNNGTRDESFQRRAVWDGEMKRFFRDRKKILGVVASRNNNSNSKNNHHQNHVDASVDRKLLWCGDMNVTVDYRDGSHWEKRTKTNASRNGNDPTNAGDKEQDGDGGSETIYEWFRDTKVCYSRFSDNFKNPPRLEENRGMPGFTTAERRRFAELLEEGDFCDVWREQHPNGEGGILGRGTHGNESKGGPPASPWDLPNYTWRGALSRDPAGVARYQGRGMRLDYFLLSPSRLGARAFRGGGASCSIRGHGSLREGLFCGSDHCAVELLLGRGRTSGGPRDEPPHARGGTDDDRPELDGALLV